MFGFWVMMVGMFVWTLGCYVCCALVATAPTGGLFVRLRASWRTRCDGFVPLTASCCASLRPSL